MKPSPRRRTALGWSLIGLALLAPGVPARPQGPPTRQVTLFGIRAVPGGDTIDPALKEIAPQLRKLLPGHGFRLLGVKSERLAQGEMIECELAGGFLAKARLDQAADPEAGGKVRLRFALEFDGTHEIATDVLTPANQLFFCDKKLSDGSRVVVAIGAR